MHDDKDIVTDDDRQLLKAKIQAETYPLHPEKFGIFGLDATFQAEQNTLVISLHAHVWRCTCRDFQGTTCGHIMALRRLLSSAFQINWLVKRSDMRRLSKIDFYT